MDDLRIATALERVALDARAAAPDADGVITLLEGLAEAYRVPGPSTRLLRALLRLA
jgi:hypothetical protein